MRRDLRLLALATVGALALAPGCTDSSSPDQPSIKPPAELKIIKLPPTHDPLFNPSVSFYAKKGVDSEVKIWFEDSQGQPGEEYLVFKVKQNSLLALPDGTPIPIGDSVLITITADPDSVLFTFEPKGLEFDPSDPAKLKIEYAEVGDDFDEDGIGGDPEDQVIEDSLSIWRQPDLGEDFVRLESVKLEDFDEIEAEVVGFSRFALAY